MEPPSAAAAAAPVKSLVALAYITALVAGCASSRTVAPPTAAPTAQSTYTNATYGWSITYPTGWTIDTQNVAFVRLEPPRELGEGLLGIHAAPVSFTNMDSAVSRLIERQEQSSQGVKVLGRRAITLVDGTPAIELDTELGQGTVGRSRRFFALAGGTAFVLDAETFRDQWPVLEPHYDRILRSFRVNATR